MLVVKVIVFFKTISHQLYGECNHHLDVRNAGAKYMSENPERFIESNIESSWMDYLANMSTSGTWCDHLIIQAVADIFNLRVHIVESDENFAVSNIVEAVEPSTPPTVIYIGHLGEYHYVSTVQLRHDVSNVTQNLMTVKKNKQNPKRKTYSREYMKEYMKRKRLSQTSQEKEKCNQQNKEYIKRKQLSETCQDKLKLKSETTKANNMQKVKDWRKLLKKSKIEISKTKNI